MVTNIQFVELVVAKGAVQRETVLMATSAILFLRGDGASCRIVLNDAKNTELSVIGTSFDEMKKKLGLV